MASPMNRSIERQGRPVEPATVGDLTEDHVGWEIAVTVPDSPVGRRTIALLRIRKWIYEGQDRVGLVDWSSATSAFTGTEYHYDADTPCKLLRHAGLPRRARRHARSRA